MINQQSLGYKDDAQACFEQAIKEGRLSINPKDKNFAGDYMYMGTTAMTDKDLFKNILTRKYDI